MLSEDEEKKTKSFFTLRALLYVMGAYMGSQITGDKMDAYYKPKPWTQKKEPESWLCVTVAVVDFKPVVFCHIKSPYWSHSFYCLSMHAEQFCCSSCEREFSLETQQQEPWTLRPAQAHWHISTKHTTVMFSYTSSCNTLQKPACFFGVLSTNSEHGFCVHKKPDICLSKTLCKKNPCPHFAGCGLCRGSLDRAPTMVQIILDIKIFKSDSYVFQLNCITLK